MADIQIRIGLKSGLNEHIVKKQDISLISSFYQSNMDAATIFYGLLSNTGSIEIIDKNGEIKNLISNKNIDSSNTTFDLYANKGLIGNHQSTSSNYQQNVLNVELSDFTKDISKYNYNGNGGYLTSITGNLLLSHIFNNLDLVIESPSPYKLSSVLSLLSSITFNNIDFDFENLNVNDLINEFCKCVQINILNSNSKTLKYVTSRPIYVDKSSAWEYSIFIPKNIIYEINKNSLFLNNKYLQVDIPVSTFETEIKSIPKIEKTSFSGTSDAITYMNNLSIYNKEYANLDEVVNNASYSYTNSSGKRYKIYIDNISLENYYQFSQGLEYAVMIRNTNTILLGSELQNYNSLDDFTARLDSTSATYICGFFKSSNIFTTPCKKYSIIYAINYSSSPEYGTYPFRIWLTSGTQTERIYIEKTQKYITKTFKSLNQIGDDSLIVKFDKNPLLTEDSSVKYIDDGETKQYPLYEYIAKNILSDYSNGIRIKTIKIACSNLYAYEENKLMVNWSKGQILQVGDKIIIENDNYENGQPIHWRITGAKFTFNGVPMLQLELQECIKINKMIGDE